MVSYAHTNLIARDWRALSRFYQEVLGCERISEPRDLRGAWLDRLTGLRDIHVVGEHLRLPGHGPDGPTLEIFSYSNLEPPQTSAPNRTGFAHIAFRVDDVGATLARIEQAGGGAIGDLVKVEYPDGRTLTVVYATDPEGNIIELQHWDRD